MSLRARLGILTAAAVAFAVVLASAAAFILTRNQMRSVVDETLLSRVQSARRIEGFPGAMRGMGPMIIAGPLREFLPTDQVVQIIDAEGNLVLSLNEDLALPVDRIDVDVALGDHPPILRDVSVGGLHLRMVTAQSGSGLAVQIARPLTEVDQTLAGLAVLLALVGLAGVVLAGGLGLLVAKGALGPVDKLTEAAEHVADTQDLSATIDVDRSDEVGRLAAAFNTMLSALQRSKEQQQQLVSNASHELRTPLTSLRTNIELLSRADGLAPDQRSELLADVTFELEELSTLVGELVDLATDARAAEEPPRELDLGDVVERAVDRARRRTGRTITVSGSAGTVEGRPNALERAVSNLLSNADKWSPPGAPIRVDLDGGQVAVSDQGPGIADDDLPHIFDRFYRADDARTMPGSGLGLAIVRQIVEDHGGSVFAGRTDSGGAQVGFEIPILT